MNKLPVIIAGGGIGGIAAALGLAQKGFRSIVLEKSARLGEIGAGIQLGPNAFHCFDYLGVGEGRSWSEDRLIHSNKMPLLNIRISIFSFLKI